MSLPSSNNRSEWRTTHRRGSVLMLGGLAMVAAAACGQEQQPALGAGTVGQTTLSVVTTTIPATTTTTIDFDRPITQGTVLLVEDAEPNDVADLVADIRGQTAGVSAQVRRLAPFPDLVVAPVAQITGIGIVLSPEEDDRYQVRSGVRVRVPVDATTIADAIRDEFYGMAWNPNDQAATDIDGQTATETVFRRSGFAPDELEFLLSVRSGAGASLVEMTYLVSAEEAEVTDDDGVTYYDRLSSWQDGLALTRAARLTEVGIETDDDSGRVFARYLISADDETEAVALLARASASGDYDLLGATADDPPTSGPLRLVNSSGDLVIVDISPAQGDDTFEVEAVHGFELDPLD